MNNLPRLLPSAPTSTLTHCYLARQAATTARLQDNTLIARAPRNPFPVEVLQQRDGILPCDSGQLLKNRDGDSLALCLLEGGQPAAQLRQSVAMKDQLRSHANQALVSQQNLQNLLRALRFHRQLAQDFLHRGNCQPCRRKGRLNLLLGARFLRFQVNAGARPLHDLALRFELFLRQQVVQRGAKRFRAHAPPKTRPQILTGYSRQQRVLFVEPLHPRGNFLPHFLEHLSRNQHQRLCRNAFRQTGVRELFGDRENFAFAPASARHNILKSQSQHGTLGHRIQHRGLLASLQRLQKSCAPAVSDRWPARCWIEHHTAANRGHRRKLPHDEPVAGQDQHFLLQAQLRQRALPRRQFTAVVQIHLGNGLAGSAVKMNAAALLHLWRGLQQLQPPIDPARGSKFARRSQRHAAPQRGVLYAREIYRGSLPGDRAFRGLAARLHAAHAQPPASREQLDLIAGCNASGNQRAGDHRTESFDRKGAVDRQPEVLRAVLSRDLLRNGRQRLPQLQQPRLRPNAHQNNRSIFQKRSAQVLFDLQPHQPGGVRVHEVAFRQRHYAALHAEQPAYLKVLAGLRLDRFIGGDHQQHQIHTTGACQHVADEEFVPGYIDKSEAHSVFFEEGKAKINSDSPALFFLEPVRMRSRERLDERRLAVVNVPGRANDHALACASHACCWAPELNGSTHAIATRTQKVTRDGCGR